MATIKKNYKSDFDAILHLVSCVGDTKKQIGWPDYDWTARFYTASHDNVYIASNIGGVLTNCFNDNGNIHVVFNNHGLGSGTLRVEFSADIPNVIYPDGQQHEVSPQPLNIELVRGRGDCGTIVDVEVMLSYIKGDKGDTGPQGPKGDKGDKGEDGKDGKDGNGYTPEQVEKLNALPTANELDAELDKAKFALFVDMWNDAAGEWGRYNSETGYFELFGTLDITFAEARQIMQRYRYIYNSQYLLPRSNSKQRALLPIVGLLNNVLSIQESFRDLIVKEMLFKCDINQRPFEINNAYRAFAGCRKLEVIHGGFYLFGSCNVKEMFLDCFALREVRIRHLTSNISFVSCSLISSQTLSYIISNAANTTSITITVHPDVYAKLTDESNTEWNQVLVNAAAKNITFATP